MPDEQLRENSAVKKDPKGPEGIMNRIDQQSDQLQELRQLLDEMEEYCRPLINISLDNESEQEDEDLPPESDIADRIRQHNGRIVAIQRRLRRLAKAIDL